MDQVPPPLVIFIDDTRDKKGRHGPVCFSHPCAGSREKKGSTKVCFCQRVTQPKIAVMFRGTGRSIADFDK